jgi:FlaA1/EpsC-like NDP-sugar epimerase
MRNNSFGLYSALNQKIVDGLIAGLSFWVAYRVLFEWDVPAPAAFQMWVLLPVVVVCHILANLTLGTYRLIWRYVSLGDAIALARNYALVPVLMLGLHYGSPRSLAVVRVPVDVIVVEYLLSLWGGLGARACRRLLYEGIAARAPNGKKAMPVVLVGAGRVGVKTANEVRAQIDLRPIGFLDDDPNKAGSVIGGLRVIGPLSSLSRLIQEDGVRQVILCVAKPSREMLRQVWATCELLGVPVKLVPSLEEILQGKVNVASYRNVEMKDLLGRNPIEGSNGNAELDSTYAGKRILITGAGGSIGSELAVQLSKLRPDNLILLDKDENGLNDAYVHLQKDGGVKAVPVVADLRFRDRLRTVFETFHPEIVFHAAAHKHVHLMEINPCEAVANNVTGTRNLVELSGASAVDRFVQISTDKAVHPTSIMGASKRVCEMIVQSQKNCQGTLFCCVRFGNVLGSRGSIVPIFQQQILRGGPVTVTHPEAKRFLMTIPEAVCLLIQAGTLAHAGDIFVLDMGEPVLIKKLAKDLIELSGFSSSHDVRIEISGIKPGEKLSEVLVDNARERLRPTRLPKIQTITAVPFDLNHFSRGLRTLERSAWQGDAAEVYRNLAALNIGFIHDGSQRTWSSSTRRPAVATSSASVAASHGK